MEPDWAWADRRSRKNELFREVNRSLDLLGDSEHMNQRAPNKSPKNCDPTCSDVVTMAERELAAFFGAVTELFGSEQAEISAEEWLHELMAIDDLPIDNLPSNDLPASPRQWRQLTVNISARLASGLNASSESIASRTLAYSD